MRNFLLSTTAILCLAGGVVGTASPAWAQDGQDAVEVAPVTVIATRTDRRTDEVPATVSVITADDIEAMLATDIKDLIRFEPGVSVPTSPPRFSAALSGAGRDGNSGFTIRGMGGDRVLIVVDGVRTPDGFAFGAQNVGRGGYTDLDLVRSVEILRGPASALYGSDGVAGAVSFTTTDPQDLLRGERFGARARVGYNSADDGWTESVAIAGSNGAFSGLLAYTRRDSHETENMGTVGGTGPSRTLPNPLDFTSNGVLGKLVWQVNENHRLRLTYDHYDSNMTGDSLSTRAPAMPPFSPNAVLQVLADDDTSRDRISLDHRFTNVLGLDRGSWTAYWQQSETRQFTFEDRDPAVDRTRDVTFDNAVFGFSAEGQRVFGRGSGVEHHVTFGGDWVQTEQEAVRGGTIPGAGETFPNRPFPVTEHTQAGLFVQDEIRLLDGRLSIIPAVRYDWYELTPKPDALYTGAVAGQDDSHVSPKLGVVYWAADHFGLFANYAVGFKAPSSMQVNSAFSNPLFGYVSIPNPDLGPETSESFEAGVRFRDLDVGGGRLSLSAVAFRSAYEDFINQVVVSGAGTPANPAVYQYVNLTAVDIEGLEGRAEIRWDNGFGFTMAASYIDGEGIEVDPLKVVAGLSYADPAGRFGGQAIVTHADGQGAADGFTIMDMTAYWNINERVTLRAGVFNLFDETYAWWSDVRSLTPGAAVVDAYTQPGRNFGVSLALRY